VVIMNVDRMDCVQAVVVCLLLGWTAVALPAQDAQSEPAASGKPEIVFHPGRPRPEPPGDVRDFETLTSPPPGFRMQRRNNFYKIDDLGSGLYRWASSGHWSNYDEAEAGSYTLPDPLVLLSGERVTDAQTWFEKRRPEIVRLYETEIFGKVPANAPKVTWEVTRGESGSATISKEVLGRIGDSKPIAVEPLETGAQGPGGRGYTDPPRILISLTLPADAKGPVPVIFGAAGRNNDATLDAILERGWGSR
jgi:hypothetical protein